MKEIPVRSLSTATTSLRLSDEFDIRSIERVLDGKDVMQALHRHDHYFLLVETNGAGMRESDIRPLYACRARYSSISSVPERGSRSAEAQPRCSFINAGCFRLK